MSIRTGFAKSLRGLGGWSLSLLVLALFVGAALWPYRFRPPLHVKNDASVRSDGSLVFDGSGMAYSTATAAWLDDARQHGVFRVSLDARTTEVSQYGPARILTVSPNTSIRDVMLAQWEDYLVLQLRYPQGSLNGEPPILVPGIFPPNQWRSIVLDIRPDRLRIDVDGRNVLDRPLPKAPLTAWETNFPVTLGNEFTGEGPWQGEIRRAVIETESRRVDLLDPGVLRVPPSYWQGINLRPALSTRLFFDRPSLWIDVALNLFCFIPFGAVVALAWGNRRGAVLVAIAFCGGASLAVETAQLFCPARVASSVDFVLNTTGAAIGGALASLIFLRNSPTGGDAKSS